VSRRSGYLQAVSLFPVPERPTPTYPEYPQLLEDARAAMAADHGFVDPVKLRRSQQLGRGAEWRARVLGHDYGKTTLLEMHVLLLAHERGLIPPLPQWLVEARAEEERREAERQVVLRARDAADEATWEAALERCVMRGELEVLRSGHARARHGAPHQLGHVVPKVDAGSGRSRQHRAGRALCETEGRAKPLDLTGGIGGPATCLSCLSYVPKIRQLLSDLNEQQPDKGQ